MEDSFLAWLDPFTHLGQTRANLLPSADNAGGEILYEDLASSDGNSKASESDCESLTSDLSAVRHKRADISTKVLEKSCMRVKKPTQNKLAVSQLELVKEVTQFMHQRLGKKSASPVQEPALDILGNKKINKTIYIY